MGTDGTCPQRSLSLLDSEVEVVVSLIIVNDSTCELFFALNTFLQIANLYNSLTCCHSIMVLDAKRNGKFRSHATGNPYLEGCDAINYNIPPVTNFAFDWRSYLLS